MDFDSSTGFPQKPESIGPKTVENVKGIFPADAGRSIAFDDRTQDVSRNAVLSGGARTDVSTEARQAANEKLTKALGLPTPPSASFVGGYIDTEKIEADGNFEIGPNPTPTQLGSNPQE